MDAFPYYISRIPYLDSNIPSKIFRASLNFEILRIVTTRTDLSNMVKCVNLLLIPIKNQGSICARIISLLKEIFGKHSKAFNELAGTANKFIKLSYF